MVFGSFKEESTQCLKCLKCNIKAGVFTVNFLSILSMPKVCLGEHSFSVNEGTEECIYAEKAFTHPDFNIYTVDNNIMLLKLSRPATLNSYAKTVSLPSLCPVANEDCMVSGWGKALSNGSK